MIKISNFWKAPLSSILSLLTIGFIFYLFYIGKFSETGLLTILPLIYTMFSDILKEKEQINKK